MELASLTAAMSCLFRMAVGVRRAATWCSTGRACGSRGRGGGRHPEGQVEVQEVGHGLGVGLVEEADGGPERARVVRGRGAELKAGVRKARRRACRTASSGRRVGWLLAVGAARTGLTVEDVAEINERVAGDGEGELGPGACFRLRWW